MANSSENILFVQVKFAVSCKNLDHETGRLGSSYSVAAYVCRENCYQFCSLSDWGPTNGLTNVDYSLLSIPYNPQGSDDLQKIKLVISERVELDGSETPSKFKQDPETSIATGEIYNLRLLLDIAQRNPLVDIPLRRNRSSHSTAFLRMRLISDLVDSPQKKSSSSQLEEIVVEDPLKLTPLVLQLSCRNLLRVRDVQVPVRGKAETAEPDVVVSVEIQETPESHWVYAGQTERISRTADPHFLRTFSLAHFPSVEEQSTRLLRFIVIVIKFLLTFHISE